MTDLEQKKYLTWKKKYDEKKRNERFDFLKPIFITFLILITLGLSVQLWISGEYKFIGQRTETIHGKVIQSTTTHLGKGMHLPKIYYSYTFENVAYEDTKIIFKDQHPIMAGDSLQIKISKDNPERNKITVFY